MTLSRSRAALLTDVFELYLNDHLAGAEAGRARVRRMAEAHADLPIGPELPGLADQLDGEYQRIVRLLEELGLRRLAHRQVAARVLEQIGRLKLNGRLLRRSPMTPVLELELMRGAVNAKAGLWEVLVGMAGDLGLDPAEFQELADRVPQQSGLLERLHGEIAVPAFEEPGT
ncbi:hypothetical protein MWU75_15725 [Ornithinimicrobium sp. F0845]|uniref:hypothetical protein n=1 Tax=Ornithinimicrobium sp. F0845 TaxID=2926412 RepID=UPI001FF30CB0|nr:hypothetical protein [Ornithinimicrobium sp. F0845]MCK0113595.1 hypothetical protein [Ornithinimicrobium sp. F0845]